MTVEGEGVGLNTEFITALGIDIDGVITVSPSFVSALTMNLRQKGKLVQGGLYAVYRRTWLH